MREQPVRQMGNNTPLPGAMPEPTPSTVRRSRRPPTGPINSYDSMPMEVGPLTVPASTMADDQPSAQVRAYRKGQVAMATAIISGSFIVSRILGIGRQTFFAAVFGQHLVDLSAYNYAFLLPNTVYNIVAGGALSSAFIPVFTDYLIERRDKKTAWHIASSAINISVFALMIFATVTAIFAPLLCKTIIAPGAPPAEANEIILLTRVMLIQPVLLGLSVITTSILQSRQRFLLPAIGSVLYNFGLLGGIGATVLDNKTGIFGGHLGILGPTWGVVAAAALQLVIQLPGLVTGKMKYTLSFDFLHPGIRSMFVLMVPRIINSMAIYGSTFIVSALISLLHNDGAYYGFQQGFQLILLPVGIFGMAMGQAAFPTLATLVATGDWPRMRSIVLSTLRIVIYLSIPVSLGLMILAEPITRLLLVHGGFTVGEESLVYIPLIYFAVGIPGLTLIEVLVRAYYALQDARTAVQISVVELFFFVGLSILLIQPMGTGGVALAQGIGSTLEAVVLLMLLRPRLGWFDLRPLVSFTAGVVAASLVATLAALLTYTLTEVVLPPPAGGLLGNTILAAQLSAAAIAGAVVYYLGARFLGIEDTLPVDRLFAKVARKVGLKRG